MPPIPSRPISGRYHGRHGRFEVELRVDVDGPRTTRRVSADYARASTGEALGSMRVDAPSVAATSAGVVITGTGSFTWAAPTRQIRITIARAADGAARSPAMLRHFAADGEPGAAYRCEFRSPWFRTVQLEEAVQRGVRRFEAYDTGALPSGGTPRTLTVTGAFAEAGIEMLRSDVLTLVDTSYAGVDSAWSDAELHAAMEQKFTLWADRPQWAIWLMHASRHDDLGLNGPHDGNMLGLLFDRRGAPRQGCAVFYDMMPGASAESLRDQLYTCVHELAHGFNLLHSWEQSLGTPPVPSRPAAASWMNYPSRFPGGKPAFWAAFAFEFDDDELVHLRHAFRDEVVMGGSPLLSSGALVDAPEWATARDDTGLRLGLAMPGFLAYGIPVTADLALSSGAEDGRPVHTVLGPRSGTAEIAIARAGGPALVFEPLLRHCRSGQTLLLRAGDPPIRDAALLHHGKDGYPFREPGLYHVQARYTAADGSPVLSDIAEVRILAPRSAGERAIGSLIYGEEQSGALLSLMGSDAPALRDGNRALQQIIERFPAHPMASIARLVRGANLARSFKTITPQGPVAVRPPQLARARALVDPVIDVVRLNRAAAAASSAGGGRRAMAEALAVVGTRPGVDPVVDAFLRTRIGEFGGVVPAIASESTATTEPPRFPPPPPPDPVEIGAQRTDQGGKGPTKYPTKPSTYGPAHVDPPDEQGSQSSAP